jgi:hypothetical protein
MQPFEQQVMAEEGKLPIVVIGALDGSEEP